MPAVEHFVLVDFENVPKVNLAGVEGKPVHVLLLIGKNQTKLDTSLSLQLHRHSAQVTPAEVGASGRNALDLTLAYYLGQAVKEHPQARFHIVSKDKDFEPLIAHLKAKGITIARHDSFAALPFLSAKKDSLSKPPFSVPVVAAPKAKSAAKAPTPQPKPAADELTKFITHLRNSPPANRTKLEHMVAAYFKLIPHAGGVKGVITALMTRRVLSIDDKNKVTILGAT